MRDVQSRSGTPPPFHQYNREKRDTPGASSLAGEDQEVTKRKRKRRQKGADWRSVRPGKGICNDNRIMRPHHFSLEGVRRAWVPRESRRMQQKGDHILANMQNSSDAYTLNKSPTTFLVYIV